MNILQPFILSFKDNQVLNLGDKSVSDNISIKDIQRTMDNRHVVDNHLLADYKGQTVHIGMRRETISL